MRRAVLNLLDNAIKYSREGGRIQVSMSNEGGTVRISIRDEGIGIAKQDLPFIFDRLFRADPARSRHSGGSGLGLALVKWVVESHNGRIQVSSEPDEGADFQVEFPLSPSEPKSPAGKMPKRSGHPLSSASLMGVHNRL